jgi:rhamnopyranosyl-N-acetylglucosaminyl-diphospho-decaprenol beta-1,3/1,4-galactofuranosyltransferase
MTRVVAVLVTWNRPELYRESIAALEAQSRPLDGIVVVDNASDVPVAAPAGGHLVRLERNTGGAGGFTVGIAEALRVFDADFVWLMDDDTVPTASALEELLAVQRDAPTSARLFGSRVVWTDGRPHPMNTPRVRPFVPQRAVTAAARHDAYPVRSISFVSLLIDARAIRELGLPIAEYFLWNDDFEYSSRLLRRYTGFIAEKSVVVHKTKVFGSTDIDPGPRFSFEVRNKAWLLRHSRALAPLERVLYTGATSVAWLRTIARSGDRRMLVSGLRQGLTEQAAGRPRSNVEVLAGLPAEVLAGIAAIDGGAE